MLETTVGYTGGHLQNPTYKQVCVGQTGHAEAVQIKYDPGIISYEKLLDYFWRLHDPTTLNRQGYEVGIQYRSFIFYLLSFIIMTIKKKRPRNQKSILINQEYLRKKL